MFREARGGVGVLLALGALGLAACGSDPDIAVGTCIADPGAPGTEGELRPVPCNSAHFGEVIAQYDSDAAAFPGKQPLVDAAEQTCTDAFVTLTGQQPADSRWALIPITPTLDAWENSDQKSVFCVLGSSEEELDEPAASFFAELTAPAAQSD